VRWLLLIALMGGPAGAEDGTADVVQELASAQLDEAPLEAPPDADTARARTERLTRALRCPVCQGLSVSDSPSDAARAMGDRIEELVRMGYTEDQITDYFVDRYGPWVELEPPAEGWNQVLFYGPLGLGLLALLGLGLRFRGGAPAPAESYTPDPELAPYRARVLEELEAGK
jgi:cytochrome c-type biogenesis protein CcmH